MRARRVRSPTPRGRDRSARAKSVRGGLTGCTSRLGHRTGPDLVLPRTALRAASLPDIRPGCRPRKHGPKLPSVQGGLCLSPRRGITSQVPVSVTDAAVSNGLEGPLGFLRWAGSGELAPPVDIPRALSGDRLFSDRNVAGAQRFCLYAARSAWVLAARAGKCSAWGFDPSLPGRTLPSEIP